MRDYIKQLEDQNEELRKMLAEEQRFSQAIWHEKTPNQFIFMSEAIVYCELCVGEDCKIATIKWNTWRAKDSTHTLTINGADTFEKAVEMAKKEVVKYVRNGVIVKTLDPRTF